MGAFRKLELAVNMAGWRIFVRRKKDKAFKPIAQRVLDRDVYTCQYCGFQAIDYQEVVNYDGNYQNNKMSNMIVACCFCSQCLFLQSVGVDEISGGQLIYLPEISQSDLNSFAHVLFCAMGSSTGHQTNSQSIYRSLKFRSQAIENKFGAGTSDPKVLGQMLIEAKHRFPDTKVNILKDIRLLPSHTKFRLQLDAWAEAAMRELEAENQGVNNLDADE